MPREVKDLKEFLSICARKDVRHVKVKKNVDATKFKVRCSKFLYTLVVADQKKASKIQKSIHPTVKQIKVTKRSHASTSNSKKTTSK